MSRYLQARSRSRHRIRVADLSTGLDGRIDESVKSLNVAQNIYNVRFSGGALRCGLGIKESSLPYPVGTERVWNYRRFDENSGEYVDLPMAYANKQVYCLKDGEFVAIAGLAFGTAPITVNYRLNGKDVILFFTKIHPIVYWDASDVQILTESPKIISLAIHYERAFAITTSNRSCLYFSDDFNPLNWHQSLDEGGFIQMLDERGKLNKVLSYLNYVYIFRDYGISRLSAYADQSDFSLSNLYVSGGKIFGDTVVLCGDRIMLTTATGMYSFDGISTRRVLSRLSEVITFDSTSKAVYHDGKYYVTCMMNTSSEYGSKALIAYDIYSDTYTIARGMDIRSMDVTDEGVFVSLSDNTSGILDYSGKIFDDPLTASYVMPTTDLGSEKKKNIIAVYLDTAGDVTLGLTVDGVRREFAVNGGVTTQKVKVNVKGSKVGIDISAPSSGLMISRPTIVYKLMESV